MHISLRTKVLFTDPFMGGEITVHEGQIVEAVKMPWGYRAWTFNEYNRHSYADLRETNANLVAKAGSGILTIAMKDFNANGEEMIQIIDNSYESHVIPRLGERVALSDAQMAEARRHFPKLPDSVSFVVIYVCHVFLEPVPRHVIRLAQG